MLVCVRHVPCFCLCFSFGLCIHAVLGIMQTQNRKGRPCGGDDKKRRLVLIEVGLCFDKPERTNNSNSQVD